MYYLKRKVLGKKHFEAITEVNIYKFSPWDLPDTSCLKSKDLEWFFFCQREKKYASGVRVKRDTEIGYWKTTGKDRRINYDTRPVGTVKTLVFHVGRPPQGERTVWVIHEYMIVDDQLATTGVQSYFSGNCFDGNGIYNGLDDLEHWALMNEEVMFGSGMQIDEYPLNGILPEDNQLYIELNDFMAPLMVDPQDMERERFDVADVDPQDMERERFDDI